MGRHGGPIEDLGTMLDNRVARLAFCGTVTRVDVTHHRIYLKRDDASRADTQGYTAPKHVWTEGITVGDRVTVVAHRDYPIVTGVIQR